MSQPILRDALDHQGVPRRQGARPDVNLTVQRGDIHAICGENGAGKSTLMKVLSGVYPHGSYDGEIVLEGSDGRRSAASGRARRPASSSSTRSSP